MSRRGLTFGLTAAALLGVAAQATAADAPATAAGGGAKSTTPAKTEKATFGGGCFWCMEALFEHVPGVKNVVSGFAGGNVPYPTYEMVCTGLTGHAEVVQVEYDPAVVPYEKLLKMFWMSHDPTTPNQQGDDFGTQYRSIILYHTETQKLAAQQMYRDLVVRKAFRRPIVTELEPIKAFYTADLYHQDYYRNHRGNEYSTTYIEPKLRKLRQAVQGTKPKPKAKPKAQAKTGAAVPVQPAGQP